MPEAFAALLPPLAAMPAVIVMLLISAGCGALLNARLSRRSRSHDANAEIPIAAGHAPEDHDLLWRALGRHVMINVADADARPGARRSHLTPAPPAPPLRPAPGDLADPATGRPGRAVSDLPAAKPDAGPEKRTYTRCRADCERGCQAV